MVYTLCSMSTVKSAIGLIGLSKIARRASVYPSAVQRWGKNGRLPQTELAGLTNYAQVIADLSQDTDEPVTVAQLIADTRKAWAENPSDKRGRKKMQSARAG